MKVNKTWTCEHWTRPMTDESSNKGSHTNCDQERKGYVLMRWTDMSKNNLKIVFYANFKLDRKQIGQT